MGAPSRPTGLAVVAVRVDELEPAGPRLLGEPLSSSEGEAALARPRVADPAGSPGEVAGAP